MNTLKLTIAAAAIAVVASTSAFAVTPGEHETRINSATTDVYKPQASTVTATPANPATLSIRDQADTRGQ